MIAVLLEFEWVLHGFYRSSPTNLLGALGQ
jgi:hypothetical protein